MEVFVPIDEMQKSPNVTKQKWPLLGDVGRTDTQSILKGPDVTKQKGPLLGDVGRTSGVPETWPKCLRITCGGNGGARVTPVYGAPGRCTPGL